jgi:uncharacterized protein
MAPSVLALIGATIVFTSILSGVFGMAGGMILLGVLLNYFDVATGMILFSIIQLFANGWRVVAQLRAVAHFRLVCGRRRRLVRGHVDDCLRSRQSDGVPRARVDAVCGGGVASRHASEHRMARRAVTHRGGDDDHPNPGRCPRTLSRHLLPEERARSQDDQCHQSRRAVLQPCLRALYFGSLSGLGDRPLWTIGPAILLAIGGTSLAPFVLERMTDHGFRQWTRAIIFAISAVYPARAGWLFFNR